MIFNMYAVKDAMTGKFLNPMFVEKNEIADKDATRAFKSNLNNIKLWKDNPNDFDLYRVGSFDDEAGAAATTIELVASGRSVVDEN